MDKGFFEVIRHVDGNPAWVPLECIVEVPCLRGSEKYGFVSKWGTAFWMVVSRDSPHFEKQPHRLRNGHMYTSWRVIHFARLLFCLPTPIRIFPSAERFGTSCPDRF